MATGTSHNEQARSSNKTIGGGLGSSTNTWGTGFWGTTPFGSGTKSNTQDAARKESERLNTRFKSPIADTFSRQAFSWNLDSRNNHGVKVFADTVSSRRAFSWNLDSRNNRGFKVFAATIRVRQRLWPTQPLEVGGRDYPWLERFSTAVRRIPRSPSKEISVQLFGLCRKRGCGSILLLHDADVDLAIPSIIHQKFS